MSQLAPPKGRLVWKYSTRPSLEMAGPESSNPVLIIPPMFTGSDHPEPRDAPAWGSIRATAVNAAQVAMKYRCMMLISFDGGAQVDDVTREESLRPVPDAPILGPDLWRGLSRLFLYLVTRRTRARCLTQRRLARMTRVCTSPETADGR